MRKETLNMTLLFLNEYYSFRNKYFIEKFFNIFVKKPFTATIFYKNVFNFTNFLMEFRHIRTYGKTSQKNSRN